ncbi:MAG: twin-arginine translocase TatA/TatE family subunit [Limisphaerales bacterium]
MNIMFAWGLGATEIIVICAAVLILFGSKKIPEFMKGLGTGVKEFKKATREVTEEIQNAGEEKPAQQNKIAANGQSPQTVPQSSNPPKA